MEYNVSAGAFDYVAPFVKCREWSLRHSRGQVLYNPLDLGARYCVEDKSVFNLSAQFILDFFSYHRSSSRLHDHGRSGVDLGHPSLFGFLSLLEPHQPALSGAGQLDVPLSGFLESVMSSDAFANLVVVVMADHGNYMRNYVHNYAGTVAGELEAKLPMLAMLLPRSLSPSISTQALLENQQRLVTVYDIHHSLLWLVLRDAFRRHLDFSASSAEHSEDDRTKSNNERTRSFFHGPSRHLWDSAGCISDTHRLPSQLRRLPHPLSHNLLRDVVPRNRTCAEAGVDDIFCSCAEWKLFADSTRIDFLNATAQKLLDENVNIPWSTGGSSGLQSGLRQGCLPLRVREFSRAAYLHQYQALREEGRYMHARIISTHIQFDFLTDHGPAMFHVLGNIAGEGFATSDWRDRFTVVRFRRRDWYSAYKKCRSASDPVPLMFCVCNR